jgi:RNA recognition motif-containing protein
LGLNGQRLKGCPIIVQPPMQGQILERPRITPLTLKISALSKDVTEKTLWNLFEPFGRLQLLKIFQNDQIALITFAKAVNAQEALKHLNEHCINHGKPIKVAVHSKILK